MAVTLESYTTVGISVGSSATLNKPTGLAVGDTMMALLTCTIVNSSHKFTVPTGWNQEAINSDNTNSYRVQIMTKVADSDDVAASNFSFSISSSQAYGCALLRLSGYGIVEGTSTATTTNTASVTSVVATGFTPSRANDFFVIVAGGYGPTAGTTFDFNSYSIATDNPTWTEQTELSDSAQDCVFAFATATRTQVTATGNVTVGVNNGSASASSDYCIAVIAVAPSLSASSNPDPLSITSRVDVLLSPASANFAVNSVTTNTMGEVEWTNQDKPTISTINNLPKP